MGEITAIEYVRGKLRLLDQTRLPMEQSFLELGFYQEVIEAIKEMRIRGAPALGVAAAYAMAMASLEVSTMDRQLLLSHLEEAANRIASSRPTAVNMAWAVERMLATAHQEQDVRQIRARLLTLAKQTHEEDQAANRLLGGIGAELIPDMGTVLTHCNTGSLATAGYGTALGVIRAAWEQGNQLNVIATETRPFLQGSRLTMWELTQLGIPSTLIVDSSAGLLLRRGEISCVIVGADRITANGDTANKIGTYSLAVLAMENHVPFYVAAPTNTIDLTINSGDEVPIEERPEQEITEWRLGRTAPTGINVRNPAFDITPHKYISAIVTERGLLRKPYRRSISMAKRTKTETTKATHA
jgi:methylthioribose-1-phosphate isomerase